MAFVSPDRSLNGGIESALLQESPGVASWNRPAMRFPRWSKVPKSMQPGPSADPDECGLSVNS